MRMFVLVLAAVWFQPLLPSMAIDGQPASILMRAFRNLNLREYGMVAGLITLACVAGLAAVANSVNWTIVAVASASNFPCLIAAAKSL